MTGENPNNPEVTGSERVRDTLGRPLQDLRISLLDRCNFRCPYCMPEAQFTEDYQFLTKSARLSHDEILRIASIAVRQGVSKLRITGGEPLLDKKVTGLVARLRDLPGVEDLALTTNGVLLAPVAAGLAAAGLQRVTISLDSVDEKIFAAMSGNRGHINKVLEGIAAADRAGLSPIKINVVVQRGVNDHTLLDTLAHFPWDRPHCSFHRIYGCRQSQWMVDGAGRTVKRRFRAGKRTLAGTRRQQKLSGRGREPL